MSRRHSGDMNGEQYLGNANPRKEVHDLDDEQTSCHIDDIIESGNDRPFTSLEAAHAEGYDNCHWCIGLSTR